MNKRKDKITSIFGQKKRVETVENKEVKGKLSAISNKDIMSSKNTGIGVKLTHGKEKDYEKILEKFDFDPQYGPMKGIPRERRYNNAVKLGLEPPKEVLVAIKQTGLNNPFYDRYI